jgi:phenylpropionate dioxygenase-like ring-hydroxylating dioxygenase large terminal subunit
VSVAGPSPQHEAPSGLAAAGVEQRLPHPVLAAAALADAPRAVRLLEQDWVLWRDADGVAHAAPDQCPHRGARLSLGRVCGGELQCAYHGWRFDGRGRCTAVPALPGFVPPASHALAQRPLVEAHGLLWLQPQGETAPLPELAALADARLRSVLVGPFDVATSAPRIVENFLDLAHFGFVHEGWLGDAGHPEVADYSVQTDARGVRARGCRAWQPRSNLRSAQGAWVSYDYDVPAPYTALLSKAPDAQAGWREAIALLLCPVEPEQSRAWFCLAVPRSEVDDAALAAFQQTIFAQDRPVLESQRPRRLPLSGGELHCAADRSSAAYRRWLRQLDVRFGTC